METESGAEGSEQRPAGKTLTEREPVAVPKSQVSMKTLAVVCGFVLGTIALAYLIVHSVVSITVTICAALVTVALNHAVEKVQKLGLHRRWAVTLVMAAFIGAVAGIIALLAPATAGQLSQFAERGPELWDKLHETALFGWVDKYVHIDQRLAQMQQVDSAAPQQSLAPILQVMRSVGTGMLGLVTVMFAVIFMLTYGAPLVRGALAEALPRHRERYERVLGKIYRSIGGYLSGLVFIGVLNATLTSIFLAIIRVPFFIPLGILSGLGSFIPLVGVTVSGALMTLIALVTKGPAAAIAVLAYIVVYQQIENHVFSPLVYKRTVRVNPLVTLLGLVFLTELAGILGAFLAVPLVASGQIIVRELLLLRRERLGLPLKGEVAPQLENPRGGWRMRRRQRPV